MKTRRENEALFSKLDMLRFARYLLNGRVGEADIKHHFFNWSNGPEARRFRWIKDK